MIPESGEKGHGEEQAISIGNVYEAVLYRDPVPGISGQLAVEDGICLPEMWLPPRIPAGQWTVSVRQVSPLGFRHNGDGAS